MKKKKRKVRVERGTGHGSGTWFVKYDGRKKGQRYAAAQFNATDFTKEYVEEWVRNQENLEPL